MISINTPWPDLPEELRRQLEAKYNEIGQRHQYEMNTPHPDDPSVPINPPNHRRLVAEIRQAFAATISQWNESNGDRIV